MKFKIKMSLDKTRKKTDNIENLNYNFIKQI